MCSATHTLHRQTSVSSSSCYLLPEYHSLDRPGYACDSVAHASEQHGIHHMHEEVVEARIDRQHGPNHDYDHRWRRRSGGPYEGVELVLQVAQNASVTLGTVWSQGTVLTCPFVEVPLLLMALPHLAQARSLFLHVQALTACQHRLRAQ